MFNKKNYFSKENILNLLISLIPLSLIIGNLAVNLNIVLICFLGAAIYKFQLFSLEKKTYQYLILIFFSYLIIITLFKNLPNLNENVLYKEHIIKSILFLRYLVLFLVIFKTIEAKKFNVKLFFISSSLFVSVLAIDIVIQVLLGINLSGNQLDQRFTGFFGEEEVAGAYLQKFSLFFIFLISILFESRKKRYFYMFLSFVFFLIIILYTGNRMPIFLYMLSICFYFVLERKFKLLLFSFLILVSVFTIFAKNNESFKNNFYSFYGNAKQIIIVTPKLFYNNTYDQEVNFGSGHIITFNSGVQIWKENKIFGNGLKSFRIKCKYIKYQTCNTHPHNYWIEILVDTGLVGFVLVFFILCISFFNFLKFYLSINSSNLKLLSIPFFMIIFFEFFPLRSTGSLFSTWNTAIIFLILPILINVEKLNEFKNKLQK